MNRFLILSLSAAFLVACQPKEKMSASALNTDSSAAESSDMSPVAGTSSAADAIVAEPDPDYEPDSAVSALDHTDHPSVPPTEPSGGVESLVSAALRAALNAPVGQEEGAAGRDVRGVSTHLYGTENDERRANDEAIAQDPALGRAWRERELAALRGVMLLADQAAAYARSDQAEPFTSYFVVYRRAPNIGLGGESVAVALGGGVPVPGTDEVAIPMSLYLPPGRLIEMHYLDDIRSHELQVSTETESIPNVIDGLGGTYELRFGPDGTGNTVSVLRERP